MNPQQEVTVSFRPPAFADQRLEQLADYLGMSKSEVLRVAFRVFDMQATLAYLQTEDAARELGDRLAAAQKRVKDDLRTLSRTAYKPRRATGIPVNPEEITI